MRPRTLSNPKTKNKKISLVRFCTIKQVDIHTPSPLCMTGSSKSSTVWTAMRVLDTNASGGLWYTDDNMDMFPSN